MAQDWEGVNRDENGNVVRGAYLTNEWFDNWYIGGSAGITAATSRINDAVITPQFDITLLKWFTPSVGARLGYQGFTGKEYLTIGYNPWQINHSPLPFDSELGHNGTLSYGSAYVHGDLLWNITNALGGYKRDRFMNVSIYANAGYYRMYDNTEGQGWKSANHDNEFAFGAGLYNTFRLTDRLVATLDFRHFSTASRYKTYEGVRTHHWTATAGLAYNIYRTYWNRAQKIISDNDASMAQAAAAMKALEQATAENDALAKKVAQKEAEIAAKDAEIKDRDDAIQSMSKLVAGGAGAGTGTGTGAGHTPDRTKLDDSKNVIELPYEDLVERANAADLVVYYYINVDKVNFSELRHLDTYIQSTLKADPDHVFYLTGSADKGTGTMERNTYLCRSRAYGVRDILIKDYGVKPENIVIKATVVSDKHLDGALDRCVIIESK